MSNCGPEWADGHDALLGAILVRNAGPAAKGGRFITVSEHSEARPHTIPKSGDQVPPNIGDPDLRGTLP